MAYEGILAAAIPAALVIGRNLLGFWKKVTDVKSEGGRKVTRYEWGQLGQTFFRIGIVSAGIFYGVQFMPEVTVDPTVSTAIATLIDLGRKGFK